MTKYQQITAFILLFFYSCSGDKSTIQLSKSDESKIEIAKANGISANEGFVRCENYVNAWLEFSDPESGLIPRNLKDGKDFWNAQDAAADNYPFMVLTSFFTNQKMFDGRMKEMLASEMKLTSRVNSLPDTYSFSKKDFLNEEIDMGKIIFGTSEYIKDGLLPLTEWLGKSPWSDRMLEMLYDMHKEIDVANEVNEKKLGNVSKEEVNGELLQTLSRVYWMTGDEMFLDWAIKIGDYYLLGNHHPTRDLEYLRLRDHGCELISGLCELYISTHFARPEQKLKYQKSLYEMLDRILEVGRNEDGMFYNAINPITGKVEHKKIADTWGYTLNGYYGIYLIDNKIEYKEAVLKVFANLHKYKNYDWERGSSDGYADAIESALNLYNRIPDPKIADWIDSEIKVMWAIQKQSGIIEGWHGDGNFARTTIMYNLWKSKGLYVKPWRNDLQLGAEQIGDSLLIYLKADKPWKGKLYFDKQRHKENMNLPMDWPRINQFSEWFTTSSEMEYSLIDFDQRSLEIYAGHDLISGIDIDVTNEKSLKLY